MAQQLRDRWAKAMLASDLPDELIRTGWAIREYANSQGCATMGIAALARDTGRSRRTIQRHLEKLVDSGHLKRHAGLGSSGRGGTTALTVLCIPGTASSDSIRDTTSSRLSKGKGCHDGAEVVTRRSRSGDAQDVAQTLLNPIEPRAGARASQAARAARDDPTLECLAHIRSLIVQGYERTYISEKFGVTAAELEEIEASMKGAQR